MQMFKKILCLCVLLCGVNSSYSVLSSFDEYGNLTASGVSIDGIIGADRWYGLGYTGSSAAVANVEAGLAAASHPAVSSNLAAVAPYIYTPVGALVQASDFYDLHATQTSIVMAGGGDSASSGIAYNSTLYSGAIATSFGTDGGFSVGLESLYNTYNDCFTSDKNISVINSSWGSSTYRNGLGLIIDSLAYSNTSTLQVFSAGNSGPDENTVTSVGVNSIVVGASANGNEYITSDTYVQPTEYNTYDKLAGFSSIGASNWTFYKTETDGTQNLYGLLDVRASVDIVAPGSYINAASDMEGSGSSTVFGTSYSSPIVAGSAALMVDYANQNFTGQTHDEAVDARVLKANMLNSADKNAGWDNGEFVTSFDGRDIIATGQALDLKTGAGLLNMDSCFTQYAQGQTGISGTSEGGGFYVQIANTGWDLGRVTLDSSSEGYYNDLNNLYVFPELSATYNLTVTLSWFRAVEQYMDDASAVLIGSDLYEADLDLGVYVYDTQANAWNLIAVSASSYNLVEHLDFTFDAQGDYAIGIIYETNSFNNTAFDIFSEQYALAWNLTEVPEPLTLAFLAFGAAILKRKKPR